ncbi:MAG: hemin uptake protein HemP, partial [Rhodospirillales bacterium]
RISQKLLWTQTDQHTRSRRNHTRRRLKSEDLLDGMKTVRIEHGKDVYRLSLTANGKLILTK